VRELITIPLYLTALLSLPDGAPFPTTKEEVLRRFVAAHEQEARRATALREATGGFQQDYLISLAAFATITANTSIADANARRSVSQTTHNLVSDGQITITVQPDSLLNTLVSNHVLVRLGDVPGYSFQHQQFQEWYASHNVARLMAQAVGDAASRDRLKTEVLNHGNGKKRSCSRLKGVHATILPRRLHAVRQFSRRLMLIPSLPQK
jgi:hypothetical protein